MSHVHVAYDTRSGQIIAVRHGPNLDNHAWNHRHAGAEHVAIIRAPACEWAQDKRYKVDVHRKEIVEAASGEEGVNFGIGSFGSIGGTASRPY